MANDLNTESSEQTMSEDTDLSQDNSLVKVPVARIGQWYHPTYGVIKFDQGDFDDITRNFKNNELGVPPYIRYGHDNNAPAGVVDAESARGSIVGLDQEGDVLFSYVRPTDLDVVNDVKESRMRFASAELLPNTSSKFTGKKVGTVLKAVALTNNPFVPNLPSSKIVSHSTTYAYPNGYIEEKFSGSITEVTDNDFFVLNLSNYVPTEETTKVADNNETVTADVTVDEVVVVEDNEVKTEVSRLSKLTEKLHDMLSSVVTILNTDLIAKKDEEVKETVTEVVVEKTETEITKEEDLDMSNAADVAKEQFEERFAALETKLSGVLAENTSLKQQLDTTNSQLTNTAAQAQMFSNNLAEQKLSNTKNSLVASGIPPALVNSAFELLNVVQASGEVKLSNGSAASLVDKMAEVLSALPVENRVVLGQVGHNLSNSADSENPYKDIIKQTLKGQQ